MGNPFDDVVEYIKRVGYHNHRRDDHSNIVCEGIFRDLRADCYELKRDCDDGLIDHWLNVPMPGGRKRKIDLLVGEPDKDGRPDLNRIRIAMENKSVVTAHRNRDARFDDLRGVLEAAHKESPQAILVGTVIVGTAQRCLNVPDRVKLLAGGDFKTRVLPRLSSGDETLWDEFAPAISPNRPDDPLKTIEKFRRLPTRPPGLTHVFGFDYLLLVPAVLDNVNEPRLDWENDLGIDIDGEYASMVEHLCRAYRSRWHT